MSAAVPPQTQSDEEQCFQQGLKGLRTTVNASHSRGRSRASSGPNAASEYDHTSTHEEYDPKYDTSLDDSGIDVTGPGHSRRSSQVVQHNIPMESLLRRPSSAYKYS